MSKFEMDRAVEIYSVVLGQTVRLVGTSDKKEYLFNTVYKGKAELYTRGGKLKRVPFNTPVIVTSYVPVFYSDWVKVK